jgi:hypothetical protein
VCGLGSRRRVESPSPKRPRRGGEYLHESSARCEPHAVVQAEIDYGAVPNAGRAIRQHTRPPDSGDGWLEIRGGRDAPRRRRRSARRNARTRPARGSSIPTARASRNVGADGRESRVGAARPVGPLARLFSFQNTFLAPHLNPWRLSGIDVTCRPAPTPHKPVSRPVAGPRGALYGDVYSMPAATPLICRHTVRLPGLHSISDGLV